MKSLKLMVCILIIFFISLSGTAPAGLKSPASNNKPESNQLANWNDLPIMFEGFAEWWETDRGKHYQKHDHTQKVLLIDDTTPRFFTFTKRYNDISIITWGEYFKVLKWQFRGASIKETKEKHLLSFYECDCDRSIHKSKCAYVRQDVINGEKYIVIRFIHKNIQGRNESYFAEWMSDGIVQIAERWCFLTARDLESSEAHKKLLAKIEKEEKGKKAKKQREEEERIRKQAEKKRKAQAEKEASRKFKNELRKKLLSGEQSVRNTMDYSIKHQASDNTTYLHGPPSDGPSSTKKYFDWEGENITKKGQYYICWNPEERSGFAFNTVIQVDYGPILENGSARVVGVYEHNINITLVNGESHAIPVLSDAYVYVYDF